LIRYWVQSGSFLLASTAAMDDVMSAKLMKAIDFSGIMSGSNGVN
jgi:hypothetical protein